MRMDPESGETALELIERLDDDELADVIYQYGDERRSRRIARSIKRALDDGELAHDARPAPRHRARRRARRASAASIPATRTFQALRIAVNGELDELEALLAALPDVVAPGGVAAILSFHSLEDRLVKRAFRGRSAGSRSRRSRIVATDEERDREPARAQREAPRGAPRRGARRTSR